MPDGSVRPVPTSEMVPRSIRIGTRRTSLRLEAEFWSALQEVSLLERRSVNAICCQIDAGREAGTSLASALRVYLIRYFRRMRPPPA